MPLVHACPPAARRTAGPRVRSRRVRALGALSISVVLATTLTACSEDGNESGGGSGSLDASDISATGLQVRAEVSRVHGALSRPKRNELEREAAEVLAGYFSAAYLHGRTASGYAGSFPGFTSDAAKLAMRDVEITADAAYAWAEEVEPLDAVADLSVVAPHGRPVGATARVLLRLAVSEGEQDRVVVVRGRLLLTPADGGLKIFGYDLALDSGPREAGNR